MADEHDLSQKIREIDTQMTDLAYEHHKRMRQIEDQEEALFYHNQDIIRLYEAQEPSPYKSLDELEQSITEYIFYYNNKRIKAKLKGLSPVQYRTKSFQ